MLFVFEDNYSSSTMAPYTGNGKMFKDKQKDYRQRLKMEEKNRLKYLRKKVKRGTATKKDKEELKVLENK